MTAVTVDTIAKGEEFVGLALGALITPGVGIDIIKYKDIFFLKKIMIKK